MLNLQKKHIKLGFNLFILTIFLSSFSFGIFAENYRIEKDNKTTTKQSNSFHFNTDNVDLTKEEYMKWRKAIERSDENNNGLSDALEKKAQGTAINDQKLGEKHDFHTSMLSTSATSESSGETSKKEISVIISFPFENINDQIILFQELEGTIRSVYSKAIHGFAGEISYENLLNFKDVLYQNQIPFYIEEDSKVESNLYYVGKNMNLRPHVWNNLGYDGDEDSSIAIIDSGIDDSHDSFGSGYSDGNFNYKIVGWRDEVNGYSMPYDDNGHGSHCAGISSGVGYTFTDGSGRTVSTANYVLDNTGSKVDDGSAYLIISKFNVTQLGTIDINCEFDDYTSGSDDVDVYAYLYKGNTQVDSYSNTNDAWTSTLTYPLSAGDLGEYSLEIQILFNDNTGDGKVSDANISFRGETHYPFNVDLMGSGNAWKGVANDTHLVGIKVMDKNGIGYSSDIISGINWAITNRYTYHITTMSLSLGGPAGQSTLINAVNNAVENGIITVVAAGNDGIGGNNIGSPGDADKVITVAATNFRDNITSYSSQGGNSYSGGTTKPDITAPGGSAYDLHTQSVDTNDNDADGVYTDSYSNDLAPMQGTSMATPAVAGGTNLIVEAMGGYSSWGYTADEAKSVKSLLLMTATETYPLLRETYDSTYSPTLDRGEKDVHEGYGRINVDMAIEAYTKQLYSETYESDLIYSSQQDSFKKHGIARYVNLNAGKSYRFKLKVPTGADFDLHIYKETPSSIGEPVMVAKGVSPSSGHDENIMLTPTESGKYYVVVKAISGSGWADLTYEEFNGEYLYYDDFEGNLNKWESTTGLWHLTDDSSAWDNNYYSPTHAMWFGQESTGTYNITGTNGNGSLVTKPINFTGLDDAFLEFNFRQEVEDSDMYDMLNVSVSTDGYNWENIYSNGSSIPSWQNEIIDLSLFVGYPSVRLNFSFDTVDNIQNDYRGCYLDDIFVYSTLKNYTSVTHFEYNWKDLSDGSELSLLNDGYSTQHLPFSFKTYNQSFSKLYLSSNGYVSFQDSTPNEDQNYLFPLFDQKYNYMIAPFWDDLNPNLGESKILVKNFTDSWVAEWSNIEHNSGTKVGSFQLILQKSGNIIFNYDEINYVGGGYTCGINYGVDTRFYNSITSLDSSINDYSILFTPDNHLPIWINSPQDQSIEFGNSFSDDVEAFDLVSISHYWIDDTTNFAIDQSGSIENVKKLGIGTYPLKIRAYDNYNNFAEANINVVVSDTIAPTWDEELTNQTINYNTSFIYDVNASDLSGIDSYTVNDTGNFAVDDDGLITNATKLNAGTYHLKVSASDPYNNKIEGKIEITVSPSSSDGDDADDGTGDEDGDDGDDGDNTNGEEIMIGIPGYDLRVVLLLSVSAMAILSVLRVKKIVNQGK